MFRVMDLPRALPHPTGLLVSSYANPETSYAIDSVVSGFVFFTRKRISFHGHRQDFPLRLFFHSNFP